MKRSLAALLFTMSFVTACRELIDPDPAVTPLRSYSEEVRASEPILYWRFEEMAGAAADSSGQGRTGELIYDPVRGVRINDKTGRALAFRTTHDGVASGAGAWNDLRSFTAEAWIRPQAVTSTQGMMIIAKGDLWHLMLDATGRPKFQFPSLDASVVAPTAVVRGETYHVAATFTDGTINLFINGESVAISRIVGLAVPVDVMTPIRVGQGTTANRWEFVGEIDETALYDKALTVAVLKRHYDAGKPATPSPAVVRPPASSYSRAVLDDAPIVYWRFEETAGVIAWDSSSHARHATFVDQPELGKAVGSKTGRAVRFRTAYDGARASTDSWALTHAVTVEAWVRPESVMSQEGVMIVDKGNTWNLVLDQSGHAQFHFPFIEVAVTGPRLEPWQTYHLVGTFAAGVMRLYVNGVLSAERTTPFETVRIPAGPSTPIHVGRGLSSTRWEFDGAIDEVAVYDVALEDEAVLRHFNAGRSDPIPPPPPPPQPPATSYSESVLADGPIAYWRFEETESTVAADNSGYNRHGRYNANPVLAADVGARTGKGVRFVSDTDGMIADVNSTWSNLTRLTVEAWVKPDVVTSPEGVIIIDKGDAWNLVLDQTGKPRLHFPSSGLGVTAPAALVAGNTYHLAATFDDGVARLYVNGALVATRTISEQIPVRFTPVHIGQGLSTFRWEFAGVIDDAAIYDKALSAAAILRHYEAGKP